MKSRTALYLLLILAPTPSAAQQALVRTPPPRGVTFPHAEMRTISTSHPIAIDSARSSFDRNVILAGTLGGIIGGVIGAIASEHQAVGAGFTHTPAVLFVATYGGLGVLLGLIAGTMLPGS